jgi:thiamine biosynthesis lipoprotein
MSATAVVPEAAYADALATALCVLGPQEGLRLIERLPRTEAVVVGLDGAVHFSKGLGDERTKR